MQSQHPKKQQYVPQAGRYHSGKPYAQFFHPTQPGGDVGGFTGGPSGAAGASLRLNQFASPHQPHQPQTAPQPQPQPQLRSQQAPPHNAHNSAAPPAQSQHHTHNHGTITHSHQVLQTGGVGGHGTGVGSGVGQVGVPPGPSPAPPGPPHDLNTTNLPPGSTQQIQQGSGGSISVAPTHSMMYPATTQTQPQGPQSNAQGQYYPHPGGHNAPSHISGQGRQVITSSHMPNFPVMPPNHLMHFYQHGQSPNLVYQIPFQHLPGTRQTAPQGQFHPQQMAQPHPQGPYQSIQYHPQGNKHDGTSTLPFRQPHGVYYPPNPQQQHMKPGMVPAPQREKKVLAIVDPNSGKNILEDINKDKSDTSTPPQSTDSSARNTPAPSGTPPNRTESAAIAAKFAEEVAKKAAEKDIVEIEPTDIRTNKQSDSSSSNVISSDSREIKEKVNNSNNSIAESMNSNLVDSGIGKAVTEPVEVVNPQPKPVQQDSQQMLPPYSQQVPQQQHLSQQPMQQMPQPPLQQHIPQQPVQAPLQLSQQPLHTLPQPSQLAQQPMPPVPQQPPQQVLPQPPHPVPQQSPQPLPQKQKSPVLQQPIQQPPPALIQQQPPQQQPAPPPAQPALQQHGQKLPQQPEVVAPQPQPPQQPQQSQPQAHKHPEGPKIEPLVKVVASATVEDKETPAPVKPEPQQQAPSKTPTPKPAPAAAPAPTPAPAPVPASVVPAKEKEPTPEPQPSQSKRGKGAPREESTPARDTAPENAVAPPAAPQQPAQPQKSPSPAAVPAQQPSVSKYPAQGQNAKEKEKKEKTPEPAAPIQVPTPQPTLPPAMVSPPPLLKEPSPPKASPSPPAPEPPNDRSSKEREVNNVDVEVNNVHPNEDESEEEKGEGPQLKYIYKDDQWSPANPDGKRQYDRRFLLELQNNPLSLKKPESLPNLEVVRDGPGRSKPFEPRGMMAHVGGGPDFTPDYVKSAMGNKVLQQPRMPGGRNSQRGDERRNLGPVRGMPGRGQGTKVFVIPTPSLGRETKLKKTENAWKPSVKDNPNSEDNQEAKTKEIIKIMRGILNKLTPEKFEKLVDTVKTMPINTTERLSAVIDLIFEKAVDEQSFSSTYAQMCEVLSLMSVRDGGNESGNSGKNEVKFRNLIINKCQKEFEKDNTEELKTVRMKEIKACTDPEMKLELEAKLVYDESKMRKRSVGNIRFIGELYKRRMLTSPIMMRIIGTLLDRRDEESLECLCKLLTTIGKILETHCSQQEKPMAELEKYFKEMQKLVNEKQTASRVRFLVMDVVDLRRNNWVPRRADNKPKTKAEVQEEVKREEMEQQIALSYVGRRDERDRQDRDRRRSRDNRGPQMSEDGWNTVPSNKGRTSFDSSRLKTFSRPGASEVTLRGTGFGSWARGSSGGGLKDHDEAKQQDVNRFNVLMDSSSGGSALAGDTRRGAPAVGGNRLAPGGGPPRQGGFGSKSMPPPSNDKESAISAVKKFVGSDRSKSTSRPESRDNSVSREAPDVLKGGHMSVDNANKFSKAIIEEYVHNDDPEEAKLCIKEKYSASTIKYFVQFTLEWVVDRDSKKRKSVGHLYSDLLAENMVTLEQFIEGSQETLGMVEDFEIDIPQVCDYFGEIYAPCLNERALSMKKMLELASYAGSKKAHVFACTLAQAAKIITPNKVTDAWSSSGLSWSTIVPSNVKVEEFLARYHVEFTEDKNKSGNQGTTSWNPEKVQADILKLFKKASNDEIFAWIETNIGNDLKSSKFIRALVTALVESQATTSNDGSSIRVADDFENKMKDRLAVVLKYVDSNETLEMQCIYALQALSVKHQHPPGLLEKCFNAFYDSEVVSEEAFDEWAKSQDPEEQEGKGVCVNSVKNFMRWLKEADVDETETQA